MEKQNLRLKVAVCALFLLGGVLVLAGAKAAAPKTMTAEAFIIVDENGVERGRFEVVSTRAARLTLEGTQKNSKIDILAGNDAAEITFFRKGNKEQENYDKRATIALNSEGKLVFEKE